jgi:hypothetical protein
LQPPWPDNDIPVTEWQRPREPIRGRRRWDDTAPREDNSDTKSRPSWVGGSFLIRQTSSSIIASIAVLAALVVGASLAVWFFGTPHATTDQWAAITVILGVGGFVFAIIATIVAVVAFERTIQRPALGVARIDYPMQALPPEGSFSIDLKLENNGQVAARFVAVRITFTNTWWRFAMLGSKWEGNFGTSPHFAQATWEGGADAVVHPHWQYDVPELGPLTSSDQGAIATSDETGNLIPVVFPSSIDYTIEIVADGMKPITTEHSFVMPNLDRL